MQNQKKEFLEGDSEAQRQAEETMQLFGTGLQRLVDEQVGLKIELERRWLDDLRHYNGRVDQETAEKLTKSNNSNQSLITVNLTRAKSNTAEAKWADLVLPTDDRNWGIGPTPVPELAKQLEDETPVQMADGTQAVSPGTNEPYQQRDVARQVMKQAKEACDGMQDVIDDQLVECQYNPVCRAVIHDAVSLGIGILKGPMVEKRAKKRWIQQGAQDGAQDGAQENGALGPWQLNDQAEYRPFADRVDPWNFFPEISAVSWSDVEFVFERHNLTKKKVRNLMKQPGFMVGQVRNLLMASPSARRTDLSYLNTLREINGINNIRTDNRYEVWEYHGPIDKNDLTACGCNVREGDPLESFEGVVWFSQGIVLKVALNHMDDDSLPYSVVNWEKDETSVFGFGVPYRMRHPQRVMNASWRMVLDNAGLSTGPQIVINRKVIEPADKVWELSARKIWWLNDPKVKAEDAFETFNIESHQQELMAIFEQAHRLGDEETGLPQMQMGGMPGETQQPAMLKTLGGTQLWMSSNNIMMRGAVKNFDDDITLPFINRMYDWNMQFNPREDIKGDYNVDARGTSVLLVKEMQSRQIVDFVNVAMTIPGGPELLKGREMLESTAKAMSVNASEYIKTKDEVAAEQSEQQGGPQDPEVMKIQLQREIAQMSLQERQIEAEASHQRAMMEREVKLTQIAVQERVDIGKIQSDAGIAKYNADWDRERFYKEIGIKNQRGDTANYGLD